MGLFGFIKNAVKSAGRAVGSVAHAVADVSSSIADTLGKAPLIGPGLKGLYGYTYGALIQSADNVVSGVRLDKVLSRHFESQVQNIRAVAPYVQTVISVVPGIGPGISGAISAGLTLAQGRPIDEALVDAVAGAMPGGALAKSVAKMGFAAASGKPLSGIAVSALPIPPAARDALKAGLRVASDVAQGKRVDQSLLAEANRQIDKLPPGFRQAAQVGVALGQGKKLQEIAIGQLPRLIAVGGPLAVAGQKIASRSPIIQQARALLPKGQHGFDVAQGLMAHSAVPFYQLQRARNAFKGEALKGFDAAVALHIGRVLSPRALVRKASPAKYVGYFIVKGMQGAAPARIRSIATTVVAADRRAITGARVALSELTKKKDRLMRIKRQSQQLTDPGTSRRSRWQALRQREGRLTRSRLLEISDAAEELDEFLATARAHLAGRLQSPPPGATAPGWARTGRWYRRGGRIIVLNAGLV
jgi:hypothetical protein